MKTYKIDDTMDDFSSLKNTLDRKSTLYKQQRKMHTTGVTRFYDEGDLVKTEYVYSFSNEEEKFDDFLGGLE